DQLILEVGPRDLRDHVVAHQVLVVEATRDVDGKLDLSALLDHAYDPVVVLNGYNYLRHDHRGVLCPGPRPLVEGRVNRRRDVDRLHEDRPAVAASGLDYDGSTL